MSVSNNHELRTLAPLGLSHVHPPFFRYHEGAVNKAFGQIDLSHLFQVAHQGFKHLAHDPCLDPATEPSKAGAAGRKPLWRIGPGSAGTQHPQNPIQYCPVTMHVRSASPGKSPCRGRNQWGRIAHCSSVSSSLRAMMQPLHAEKSVDLLFMK
ncbi:MAG: hypothetical protein JWQ21_617 [Herminiimonas sp.]|nr:hypothetical protein [Herminiimonas sp.]